MKDKPATLYGDRSLATQLQHALAEENHRGACVALVTPELPDGSVVAGVGADPQRTFHLGSIGKAINGLIYSTMLAEGTLSPGDTLERFLPLGGSAAGTLTLESLLTHTSGLPTVGGGRRATFRAQWRLLRKKDPHPETLNDILTQLRKARLTPSQFRYSNLGGAALGHALAAAEGVSYAELVAYHITDPLGCPHLHVLAPGDPELPSDVPGLSVFNTAQEQWAGEGYAPAGGIRASAEDLAIILEAILKNPRSGWVNAFTPLRQNVMESADGFTHSIGAGWFIQQVKGDTGELSWHNGYAAGFGSAIVLDRDAQRGVFISLLDGTMQADPIPAALSLMR